MTADERIHIALTQAGAGMFLGLAIAVVFMAVGYSIGKTCQAVHRWFVKLSDDERSWLLFTACCAGITAVYYAIQWLCGVPW